MPLYELLHENNLVTTHFMIGVNIIGYPQEFLFAYETLQSAYRTSRSSLHHKLICRAPPPPVLCR